MNALPVTPREYSLYLSIIGQSQVENMFDGKVFSTSTGNEVWKALIDVKTANAADRTTLSTFIDSLHGSAGVFKFYPVKKEHIHSASVSNKTITLVVDDWGTLLMVSDTTGLEIGKLVRVGDYFHTITGIVGSNIVISPALRTEGTGQTLYTQDVYGLFRLKDDETVSRASEFGKFTDEYKIECIEA